MAMEGRIHSDLFAQDCYILGAVLIKIKLVRSREAMYLTAEGKGEFWNSYGEAPGFYSQKFTQFLNTH